MSTIPSSETTPSSTGLAGDNQGKLQELCRLVQLAQGGFSFVLVEFDLPRRRHEVLDGLAEAFPGQVETISLTPPPADESPAYNVLDQLRDHMKAAPTSQPPAVVVILGFERLFLDPGDSDKLRRAIQPLNLGRNLLAEQFPYPVLLCLPPAAMATFLQTAPDLTSWLSGFYQFRSDQEQVRAELDEVAGKPMGLLARWRVGRRPRPDLEAETRYLEGLVADAEALPADAAVTARLYRRLGWMWVFLGLRAPARRAFAEMERWAKGDPGLIHEAEQGRSAADRLAPATRDLDKLSGAAALTQPTALFGRESELERLWGRLQAVDCRFLALWGETGCGKSSLVRAGLLPRLQDHGYLHIVVDRWDHPEDQVRGALIRALEDPKEAPAGLADCLGQLHRQTGKTIVVVCDQFEQFFMAVPSRADRRPLIEALGTCVAKTEIPCKFLLVIRQDSLGNLAEFDNWIPEPLEERKRLYLPPFGETEALQFLKELSHRADLSWTDDLLRSVVADLTEDGRVSPIRLQLAGASLVLADVDNLGDYARAGRVQGLLGDYIDLVLNNLYKPLIVIEARAPGRLVRGLQWLGKHIPSPFRNFLISGERKAWVRLMKRLLLSLVADPRGRLTLTLEEIAGPMGLKEAMVARLLDHLIRAQLVRRVPASLQASVAAAEAQDQHGQDRYELTHDYIATLVLQATRDLQDKRRLANRVLQRALEDSTASPRYTLGLSEWLLVKRHADEREVAASRAQALLRRSILKTIGYGVSAFLVIVLSVVVLQLNSGHVTVERDYADRVVVRRGQPELGFLAQGGGAVILDTGFTYKDLDPGQVSFINGMRHVQWDHRQSGILDDPKFLGALRSKTKRGQLLCQVGRGKEGVDLLAEELQDSHLDVQIEAILVLERAVIVDPSLAPQEIGPLLSLPSRGVEVTYLVVDKAVPRTVEADPTLAMQALGFLLEMPFDDTPVYSTNPLARVARANPGAVIDPLLKALADKGAKGGAAARTLRQMLQAKPEFVAQVRQPLLTMLENGDIDLSLRAAYVLGQVVQAEPALAKPVLDSLLAILRRPNFPLNRMPAATLVEFVHADRSLADRVLEPLLTLAEHEVRFHVSFDASSLAEVVTAKPALAAQVIERWLKPSLTEKVEVTPSEAKSISRVAMADPEAAIKPLLTALGAKETRSETRRAAAQTLWELLEANSTKLADSVLKPLLNGLTQGEPEERMAIASGLVAVKHLDPETGKQVLAALKRMLEDKDPFLRRRVVFALPHLTQAIPELALTSLETLRNALLKDEDRYVREEAAENLGELVPAVQTDHSLAAKLASEVVDSLLKVLTDERSTHYEVAAAAKALGPVVEANHDLASRVDERLRLAFKNSSDDINFLLAAIPTLGELALANPTLAADVLDSLLELLHNSSMDANDNSWKSLIMALTQVLQADPTLSGKAFDSLVAELDETNRKNDRHPLFQETSKRISLAGAIGRLAREDNGLRERAFDLLTNHSETVRGDMLNPLAEVLAALAEDEAKTGGDPVTFLLDHLTGRRCLMPVADGDANTQAGYRNVVVGAMAQWLASDKPGKEKLQDELQRLRLGNELHLRIAAWDALAEATELAEKEP